MPGTARADASASRSHDWFRDSDLLAAHGFSRGDSTADTASATAPATPAQVPQQGTSADGASGTIDRIGPPGEELGVRGGEEGQEDLAARRDGDAGGTDAAGSGGTPAGTAPSPDLSVTTSFTSTYDQPNSLSVSPFGSMSPSFEFTGVSWTVSGDSCAISAQLQCHYPWGVNGGSCTDVPDASVATSAAHPSSGKKVWETIVDDLTPAAASPHKSPRNYYWSQGLTERHEQYHGTDDYDWVTSTGKPDAEAFIQSQTVSRAAAGTDVADVLERARRQIAQGSDAYYGVSLPHSSRPGEIRAYADGQPHYQALADAVAARGRELDAAGSGGGGGTPGTGGGGGGGSTPSPTP